MKKIIITLTLFIAFAHVILGQKTTIIDGIPYQITSDSTVRVNGKGRMIGNAPIINIKDVVIPNFVILKGKRYIVTEIGEFSMKEPYNGEKHHPKKSIILPNSIKEISEHAFGWCRNLERIIMPDHKPQIGSEIFIGCYSLAEVRGITIKYPKYIIDLFKYQYKETPFSKKIPIIESSFTYFAENKILELINNWQQKKEYETTAQWQQRVTEEARNQKLQEVIEQVRKEYIEKNAPKSVKYTIGSYDADYGVFPITLNNMKPAYVQVPASEAQDFKNNFSNVVTKPTYGIVDDHIGVSSYTCVLNGKEYVSPRNYEDAKTDMAINLPPLEINIGEYSQPQASASAVTIVTDKSIDMDIPVVSATNKQTFAVIIGNENYQKVSKVQFAQNDANTFAAYCQKTLGLPQKNVRVYKDATYATMLAAMDDIKEIAKAYKGELDVIFYYAGHGVPNESSGAAYLLPTDTDGRNTEVCYPLERLYQELGSMNARSVTVFMDACFSGSERGNNMLTSARGVAIKAKSAAPHGNMVVFSAASGDETAYPYKEKGHGLFTYFLLKKIQETKGDVTLGELGSYIIDNVSKESIVSNGKSQTPTAAPSQAVADSWRNKKLR